MPGLDRVQHVELRAELARQRLGIGARWSRLGGEGVAEHDGPVRQR
jgi:hypothetical protein